MVEDNDADSFMIKEAISGILPCEFDVITDGQDAMDFLLAAPKYAQRMLPDVIVLDLNLPRRSGGEILRAIRAGVETRDIPVVVVSSWPGGSVQFQSARANAYINKPMTLDAYTEVGRQILRTYYEATQERQRSDSPLHKHFRSAFTH